MTITFLRWCLTLTSHRQRAKYLHHYIDGVLTSWRWRTDGRRPCVSYEKMDEIAVFGRPSRCIYPIDDSLVKNSLSVSRYNSVQLGNTKDCESGMKSWSVSLKPMYTVQSPFKLCSSFGCIQRYVTEKVSWPKTWWVSWDRLNSEDGNGGKIDSFKRLDPRMYAKWRLR